MRAFEEGCAAEVVYLSTLKSGEETDTCASLSSATTTQYVDREPNSRSTWRNVANLALVSGRWLRVVAVVSSSEA